MPSMKKKAEATLKRKVIDGLISAPLLEETIMNHSTGLAGYWNSILSLSENLLRSCQQNSTMSPCASVLYTSSFKACDSYYRQEIVGSLVTHIGSGVESEMNIALSILLHLSKSDVSSVTPYGVFIKGILDYLDNLNLGQTRTLFDIFSLIALTVSDKFRRNKFINSYNLILHRVTTLPTVLAIYGQIFKLLLENSYRTLGKNTKILVSLPVYQLLEYWDPEKGVMRFKTNKGAPAPNRAKWQLQNILYSDNL